MTDNLKQLQTNIGYTFQNQELLRVALTHRSSLNEQGVKESNERLEFLGDAVLELVVTDFLYHKRPVDSEGFLTAARSAIVRTETLSQVARDLEIGSFLHMSKGEAMGGGRENSSLLENTIEALIGAIYKDSGLTQAQVFIEKHILPKAEAILAKSELKDPKSLYQEKIQAQNLASPVYKVVAQEGPDHNKIFEVAVFVDNRETGRGKGKSKQEAEQQAAQKALDLI